MMLSTIWTELVLPLLRIMVQVSIGLVAANFIESLNWTHRLAVIARPLIRLGRLSAISGAGFSMAFFSGVSANSMLAEAYDQGRLSKAELVLANLFNSLPRFFLHLPTVFFLTAPLIKGAALIYVGLTFTAALVQTILVIMLGRVFLSGKQTENLEVSVMENRKVTWREALAKSVNRFKKRIPKLFTYTVPVYILFFFLSRYGFFAQAENFLAERAAFLAWLHPKSLGIIVLQVTAEFSSGLAAAGALLADNSLGYREVVLALLVGNVLAAPIRAVVHQIPYYVGIFTPRLALELVGFSQLCRMLSLLLVAGGYFLATA